MTDEQLMKRIDRDRLRAAERDVAKAKRQVARAEEATQRAWDKRTEADEALAAAEHTLRLVRLSQEMVNG